MPQTTQHFVTDTANLHGNRCENLKCHNQNREFQQAVYEPTNCGPLIVAKQSDHQANTYVLQNGTFRLYSSIIGYDAVQPGKERNVSAVRADARLQIVTTKIIIRTSNKRLHI